MPAPPAFALRSVTVEIGGHRALDDVTLEVAAGERIAVIGPSGAGKTTLIGVLNGTVGVTAGTVEVLGHDLAAVRGRRLRSLRRGVGTIHQRFDLVEQLRTVHNVNAGRVGAWPLWKAVLSLLTPRDIPTVQRALERVGVGDKRDVRTGDLSGGEQQRVAIARVLVQEPAAILADEPISSLDPARGKEIIALLRDISLERGATLIAGLHHVATALAEFERVVGLRAGRIAFDTVPHLLDPAELTALYATEHDRSGA